MWSLTIELTVPSEEYIPLLGLEMNYSIMMMVGINTYTCIPNRKLLVPTGPPRECVFVGKRSRFVHR